MAQVHTQGMTLLALMDQLMDQVFDTVWYSETNYGLGGPKGT